VEREKARVTGETLRGLPGFAFTRRDVRRALAGNSLVWRRSFASVARLAKKDVL
jgi:hypothetical protein